MLWNSNMRWAVVDTNETEGVCFTVCPKVSDRFSSEQPFSEKPPLLQRWTAYKMPLRHVEVLEVADMLLILAASDDGSAGLWTTGGKHVGHFGQKVIRNIADSTTYLRWSRMLQHWRKCYQFNMNNSKKDKAKGIKKIKHSTHGLLELRLTLPFDHLKSFTKMVIWSLKQKYWFRNKNKLKKSSRIVKKGSNCHFSTMKQWCYVQIGLSNAHSNTSFNLKSM